MQIKNTVSFTFLDFFLTLGPALGLSLYTTTSQLIQSIGTGPAITSILIGNGILWFLGIAVINMAENKFQSIENIKNYLGKLPSTVAAGIWIIAFIIWFAIQLKSTVIIIAKDQTFEDRLVSGIILGLIISIISIFGAKFIKNYAKYSSGFLLTMLLLLTITSGSLATNLEFAVSLKGILVVIFNWLPLTVSLPTIFRHSKSESDSIIGLTLITLTHIGLQLSAVLFGIQSIFDLFSESPILIYFTVGLAMCLLINLINIYCASSGLEAFLPSRLRYLNNIGIGIFGTATYAFLEISKHSFDLYLSIRILEKSLTSCMANLGIVLIINYLVTSIVQHRTRKYEKFWNAFWWLVACAYSTTKIFDSTYTDDAPLIAGMVICFLGLIFVLFIEETIWSFYHLKTSRDLNQHLD